MLPSTMPAAFFDKNAAMAVLLHLSVAPATKAAHDDLDARMAEHLTQAGGPPAGLMSHVVYPHGEGFVVADVWRTEAEGRSFFDDVLQPMVTNAGLGSSGLTVHPVWGFARP